MKQKKLLTIGIAVFLLLAIFSVFRSSTEQTVCAFVKKHQAQLEDIANACFSGKNDVGHYKTAEVDGVYGDIVQFYHSGAGFGPSTTYYGFYYAEDGMPSAYQNVDLLLEPTSDGAWTWSDGTDNGGITRHITGNWFYYAAWF